MKGLLTAVVSYVRRVIEKLTATGHNGIGTGHVDQTITTLTQPDLEADCLDVHDLENITPR